MPIQIERYTCRDIHSVASVETLESYEQVLDSYRDNNFTYIPLPLNEQYFDLHQNELKPISDDQFIDVDRPVLSGLEKLLEHPFVLTRNAPTYGYKFDDGTLRMVSPIDGMDAWEVADTYPEYISEVIQHEEGKRWGIMTLADVNRHATRAALYPVYAELEQRFSNQLAQQYESPDLLDDLDSDIRDRWETARAEDIEVHVSEYLHLYQMKELIEDRDDLREAWGFNSKNKFDDHFGGPISLRNTIMHPARTLVHDRADLEKLLDRVQRLTRVLSDSDAGQDNRSHDRLRG
jgi:hypothetical protein